MELFQRIFEHIADAVLVVDGNGRITHSNAQASTLFGYSRDELTGRLIETLMPDRFAAAHAQHRAGFVAAPLARRMGAKHLTLQARGKDDREFPVDIMISPLQLESALLTLCAVRDISERIAMEEQLRQRTAELEKLHEHLKLLASRDGLTGLLNRRTFQEQVEWLLRNAARRGECISLLMIDLDFFKHVNDRFGHAEGDRLLLAVADALRATCRQNDIAARYGGEEFAVALPDTDEHGGTIAADAFRGAISRIAGLRAGITASVGIVTFAPGDATAPNPHLFEDLINTADRALYAAKHAGRNRVCHVNSLPPV